MKNMVRRIYKRWRFTLATVEQWQFAELMNPVNVLARPQFMDRYSYNYGTLPPQPHKTSRNEYPNVRTAPIPSVGTALGQHPHSVRRSCTATPIYEI